MADRNGSSEEYSMKDIPRILSLHEQSKETESMLHHSLSTISQSPPPYSNVSLHGPPSYKTIFPAFFRTFSLPPEDNDRRPDGQSSDEEPRSVHKLSILVCICFVLVIMLTIGYCMVYVYSNKNSDYLTSRSNATKIA